jgi:SAM-dependent methyltransferase
MTAIATALEGCESLLNVGAGTGSYEPTDREVIAVEPSSTMIKQRPRDSAPVVQASAEALPFADGAFAAVLAVLTVHHWRDLRRGLAECARVARERSVFLTIDIEVMHRFWLYDYFPRIFAIDRGNFPAIDGFAASFAAVQSVPVPIPADCRDGFLGAYWLRPQAYLDALVRASISTFGKLKPAELEDGLRKLREDLSSGAWPARYAALAGQDSLDVGYRLLICRTAIQ